MRSSPIKVTAAILCKDGKVFIAKRNSSDALANKWEFPGGKIEKGETPEACLARELMEEFDIHVTVGDFVGSNVYHYEDISIELLGYKTVLEQGDIILNEHSDYKWVELYQLSEFEFAPADLFFVDKLMSGEITFTH